MRRILAYSFLAIAAQVALIILAVVVSSALQSESAVVGLLYAYLPTILFIQYTGNAVGCARMIEPLLYGVPLGIIIYGLAVGLIISGIKRVNEHTIEEARADAATHPAD